jgi:hypothetical protein
LEGKKSWNVFMGQINIIYLPSLALACNQNASKGKKIRKNGGKNMLLT